MKNKNDNLKEKEIKREAPLKENELESVSGGYFVGECTKGGIFDCHYCSSRQKCPAWR